MATMKYSDLLVEVLPHLSVDPSNPVTEHAIKKAVIEFCNRSWVWKFLPDPADITAGEAYYDLEYPNGGEISSIIDMAVDGVPITPKSIDWLNSNMPRWQTTLATPKYYTQLDTEQVILAEKPPSNITGGLTMTLAIQPDQKATSFPRWIATQYLYVITAGALSNLMLMTGTPWANEKTGTYHLDAFTKGVNDAKTDGVAGLGRAQPRSTSQH